MDDASGNDGAGESIIGVIPSATLMKGFLGMGSRLHTLIVTTDRLIFARTTTEMLKTIGSEMRDAARAEGAGRLGQWSAQTGAQRALAARYVEMAPDEILAQHEANFSVPRDDIVTARFKAGRVDTSDPDRLIVKAKSGKYDIHLGSGIEQAREVLVEAEMV